VASERQIAANCRNARRSTGPRSSAGKSRASRNSYRHGLSANIVSSTGYQKWVTSLARKIAGQSCNPIILEYARMAAEAELAQVRFKGAKVEAIHAAMAFGDLEPPRPYTVPQMQRLRSGLARGLPEARVPRCEPERSTRAIRRALPELLRLERYARRAAGRRDRALRIVFASRDPSLNRRV
jgi:hypothetical protein